MELKRQIGSLNQDLHDLNKAIRKQRWRKLKFWSKKKGIVLFSGTAMQVVYVVPVSCYTRTAFFSPITSSCTSAKR